ncbi:MAG: AsnC family transcriptional regulator [Chloroflexota bacterium]|nr:AsnC family transcriptional regulator [Chloroflexota bacterium]
MDLIDRKLLNLIQSKFPMVDRPYLELGEELEIGEPEVISRLDELKRQNVVRQVSAIFDTRRLGYKTTLVAFAYEPDQLNEGALFINRHPGVSHNYAREGSYYNLWFTLAVPPAGDLQKTVEWMAEETGALNFRVMPTIRFFKIGVNFDMVEKRSAAHNYSPDNIGERTPAPDWNKAQEVSEFDKSVIRELQEDLELSPRPFDAMSERLGLDNARLFALADEYQERKIMRRYSAVLHHRRSGFRANAMVVWQVPPERAEEVGMTMAQHSAVTHCYERPTFPDWPYSHFSMIHATTQDECEEIAREISQATQITDNLLLYSTREYKKTRVRYFVEDYEEFWENEPELEEAVQD